METQQTPKAPSRIIIIGAGAAGLYAAKCLKEKGVQICILEASAKHGGRVRDMHDENFSDFPICLGAENIHGSKNQEGPNPSFLYADIKALDAKRLVRCWKAKRSQDELYFIDGKTVWDTSYEDDEIDEVWDFWDQAYEYSGPDITMAELLQSKGITPQSRTWHFYESLIGGEYGTSIERLGMNSFSLSSDLWLSGEKDFSIDGHSYLSTLEELYFSTVLDDIIYSSPVVRIKETDYGVLVEDTNGNFFSGNAVIITASLAVLKDDIIDFVPPLPDSKREAINTIGMDAILKVVLTFHTTFWKKKRMFGLLGPDLSSICWAPGKLQTGARNNVLISYITGKRAERIRQHTKEEAIAILLAELDQVFPPNLASKNFSDYFWMDWKDEPYIRGGYSYPAPNTMTAAGASKRDELAKPIRGRLYFAGEATAKHHPATVHGALESGRRVANEVIEMLYNMERDNSKKNH